MLAAGCASKSRFWCTTQQKVRLKLAFLTPQKRQKNAFFLTLPCRMAVSSERNKDREAQTRRGSRWPAVLWCSVSRSNRRGDGSTGAQVQNRMKQLSSNHRNGVYA